MKMIFDNIKQILALLVVLLAFGYFFIVLWIEQKVNDQVLIAIVGTLGLATGYYWGASTGGAKKDEVIASLTSNPIINNSENTTINETK